jgi:tetratricopeptide (TPR) repeat protein
MAYVRARGNQLAIVQGEREPETGKVEQRILFTLYSKAEALEALGRGDEHGAERFRQLLEDEHPDVKFNWKQIRKGISERLGLLPELYEYGSARLRGRFRKDLCAFTRQLILADPQDLISASQLLEGHRYELEYLAELIQWRLKLRKQERNQWNTDNPFYWRFALRGSEVPPDTEEQAADLYEQGEYERAEAVFHLLIDCFDGYAEGYNYLGLIALERGKLEDATTHFRKVIEVGRKLFPKRIAKKSYWTNLSTRPYMRGLRNLTHTLNRAGRYDEALVLCDRLEQECDDITALSYRSTIYLNIGQSQKAADAAIRLVSIDPSESFKAAFALFELGRSEDAFAYFLHAALNHPGAARILLGINEGAPRTSREISDHNTGVNLRRELHGYLSKESRPSRRFFEGIGRNPQVRALLEEMEAVVERWHNNRSNDDRKPITRMNLMHELEFAREKAEELRGIISKYTSSVTSRPTPVRASRRGSDLTEVQ